MRKKQRPNDWHRRWLAWHAADMLRDADKFWAAAEDDRNSAKERRWAMKQAEDLRHSARQMITCTEVLRLAAKALRAMERGKTPRDFLGDSFPGKHYNDEMEKVRREASRAKYGRRMVVVQTPGRLVINPISVKEFRDADASGKFARMTDFAIRRALRGRNQAVQGKPGRPKKLPRPKG